MRSEGDRFHDRVVGGVADEGLLEVVDDRVRGGEEDIGAVCIHCDTGKLSAAFFGVLLGCWSPVVQESFDHSAVLNTDICRCWDKVLYPSVEISDDMSGQVMVMSRSCLGVVDGELVSVFVKFPISFLEIVVVEFLSADSIVSVKG